MLCKIISFQGLQVHEDRSSSVEVADLVAISVTVCPLTDVCVVWGVKEGEGSDPHVFETSFPCQDGRNITSSPILKNNSFKS